MKCITEYDCPMEVVLDMIGGKYKALILQYLKNSTLRFNELKKLLKKATPKVLTQQLRELENDDLIYRKIYPVVLSKVKYTLTKKW